MDTTAPRLLPTATELVRARIAISVVFFMLGTGAGLWAVHIPIVKARLGIDPAILGIALLTMAIGAVGFMPVTGWAIARFGSRLPTLVATFAYVALTPLPVLAPSIPFLFVVAFLFGASMGALDVAMNTQASELETARGKPTMSSFHGFFSIGGLAGALIGAGVIGIGWGNGEGALVAAAVFLAISVFAVQHLLRSLPPDHAGPRFALPSKAVIGIGLVAFLCFAIEGAVTDWSALYLSSVKGASPTMAATGFALYSLAMAFCRLVGDPVVARLGRRVILVGGGLLMALGMAIALLSPWPLVAAIGFALVGIGAANVVPVVFSAGGQTPGVPPSVGVAAVVTLGYSGFLIAPPVLGFVAHAYGLSAALTIVLAMALAITLGTARRRAGG
jgi:MFS family permease